MNAIEFAVGFLTAVICAGALIVLFFMGRDSVMTDCQKHGVVQYGGGYYACAVMPLPKRGAP